jgi:hypothetical protein
VLEIFLRPAHAIVGGTLLSVARRAGLPRCDIPQG